MPFCISCGVRIPDGATKCAACEPAAAPAPPAGKCPGCGAAYASPTSKFCMQCGQPRKAPAPQAAGPAKAPQPKPAKPAGRVCPNCGQPAKPANAKFCVYCAAPLPQQQESAATPAPTPDAQAAPQPAAPPPAPKPQPLNKEQKSEAESVAQARLAAYQKTGRLLLAACHAGKVDKASLPADLGSALDEAFTLVAKGHARLLAVGICPQCQDVSLDAESRTCLKCGLKAPSGTKEPA
jgi:hypothetical protein